MDYGHSERLFFQKSWTFELKQTFFAEIFWGIWGIFVQTFSTHVGTLSFLSMFSNIQPFISTKKNYPTPKHLFGSKIWILAPKNLRFGLCVSVVSAQMHWKKKPMQFISVIVGLLSTVKWQLCIGGTLSEIMCVKNVDCGSIMKWLTYRLGERAAWRPTHFSYYQVFSCIFH